VIGRILILIGLVILLALLVRWILRTPRPQVVATLKKVGLWGGLGALLILVASGRLPWLYAALTAAVPVVMRLVNLLRLLPALQQLAASLGLRAGGAMGAGATGPQTSSIRTRFIEMSLDHESGAMDGRVLEGPLQGRQLSSLDLKELLDLLELCRAADAQSTAVLEAYLDRTQGPDWRTQARPGPSPAPSPQGPMSREEAAAVLGVSADAGEEEIRTAHRRLMQKLHPDRGGSTYLAAKINQAKDTLLGHR
jgi:hypothetical protein